MKETVSSCWEIDLGGEERYEAVNANTSNESQAVITIRKPIWPPGRPSLPLLQPYFICYPPLSCPFLHRSIDYMFVMMWQWYITICPRSIYVSINYARVCSILNINTIIWNYVTFILYCFYIRVSCNVSVSDVDYNIIIYFVFSLKYSTISTSKTGSIKIENWKKSVWLSLCARLFDK